MGATCESCCSQDGGQTTDTLEKPLNHRKSTKVFDTSHLGAEGSPDDDDYHNTTRANSFEYGSEQQHYTDDSDYDSVPSQTQYPSNDYDDSVSQEQSDDIVQKAIKGFKDAVKMGNDSLVMHYMQEYETIDLLDTEWENGDCALHVAVRESAYNLIIYLLTNGISPNKQNKQNGNTSLHEAVLSRDVRVVALLCKYDADPQVNNEEMETPLTLAQLKRDEDIIELLLPETQEVMMENLEIDDDITTTDVIDDILSPEAIPPAPEELAAAKEEKEKEEKRALRVEELRISRHNPFSKIKRRGTAAAVKEMAGLTKAEEELPILQAWLSKQQDHIPYQWQRRWVIVKGSYMLWSDIQRTIKDPKSSKERARFNNSINIMAITKIKAVDSKSQRKFIIRIGKSGVKQKKKEYLWRCASTQDRVYWMKGIKQYIDHTKKLQDFLRINK